MFNVRLGGGHLYGKQLFTWLSLVVSLIASFYTVLFPTRYFYDIWDLIESVSEGFLTYSSYEIPLSTTVSACRLLLIWLTRMEEVKR